MSSSFFKPYLAVILVLLVFSTFLCIFIPALYPNYKFEPSIISSFSTIIADSAFPWPTPGYTTITSPFGRRNAPTSGASTFHSGVDIGAPTGTNIIAVCSGRVTFLGFSRSRRIYYYYNWRHFLCLVLSRISWLYCLCWAIYKTRANHWKGWPYECVWGSQ